MKIDVGSLPKFVTDINNNDVLMGRGFHNAEFEGNKRWQVLVASRRGEYLKATSREARHRISEEVVQEVYTRGGRFIRRIITTEEAQELEVKTQAQAWRVIPPSKALFIKVKQLMRDVAEDTRQKQKHRREARKSLSRKGNLEMRLPQQGKNSANESKSTAASSSSCSFVPDASVLPFLSPHPNQSVNRIEQKSQIIGNDSFRVSTGVKQEDSAQNSHTQNNTKDMFNIKKPPPTTLPPKQDAPAKQDPNLQVADFLFNLIQEQQEQKEKTQQAQFPALLPSFWAALVQNQVGSISADEVNKLAKSRVSSSVMRSPAVMELPAWQKNPMSTTPSNELSNLWAQCGLLPQAPPPPCNDHLSLFLSSVLGLQQPQTARASAPSEPVSKQQQQQQPTDANTVWAQLLIQAVTATASPQISRNTVSAPSHVSQQNQSWKIPPPSLSMDTSSSLQLLVQLLGTMNDPA